MSVVVVRESVTYIHVKGFANSQKQPLRLNHVTILVKVNVLLKELMSYRVLPF